MALEISGFYPFFFGEGTTTDICWPSSCDLRELQKLGGKEEESRKFCLSCLQKTPVLDKRVFIQG